MLNGLAPILIFNFPFPTQAPRAPISGIPLVQDFIENVGLPIPIYLDEATGLYVESETKLLNVDTDSQQTYDNPPKIIVTQRGVDSNISINMLARRDSIPLAALLALIDFAFGKLVLQNYGITYLNGPTTIFDGKLDHFSTSVGIDDELLRITLQISKANGNGTVKKTPIFVLPPVAGAVPVTVTP